MAVYTKLNEKNLKDILSNYNYFLSIDKKKYILTVYEKRVKTKDLPFFSELMTTLNKSNFKCPVPIINNNKQVITEFNNKKLMIVTFLEGKAKSNLSPDNCKSVGIEVAKMHEITKNFNIFITF